MRFAIGELVVVASALTLLGCGSRPTPGPTPPDSSPKVRIAATQPILYYRTGGIAGTDDRVVIWPDGVVLVSGKLLPDAEGRVDTDVVNRLSRSFAGWEQFNDFYPAPGAADAYTITISYGDKTIEASDLAPNLPEPFRRIFTEIEAIAAAAQSVEPRAEP